MSAQESSLTFQLDGGMNTVALEDTVAPPQLVDSDNTRLSVIRGTVSAAPAPELVKTVTAGAECRGIIPAGHVESAVAFFHKSGGQTQRIAGDSATLLESPIHAGVLQNAYLPTEIAKAGVVPGSLEIRPPLVTVYEGMRFYASMRANPLVTNGVALYACVLGDDGRVIVAPTLVAALGAESFSGEILNNTWVGLTSHSPNGVRIWYRKADTIYRRALAVAGLTLNVGTEVTHSTTGVLLGHQADVVSGDSQFGYLLHINAASTQCILDKVDIVADTYARTTLAQFSFNRAVALSYLSLPSFPYLAITYRSGAQWFKAVYRADTMVQQWTTMSTLNAAGEEPAVQFLIEPDGSVWGVFAITKNGELASLSPTFVLFETRDLFTGTLDRQISQNWMRLQDRGATVTINAVERIPVFTLERNYNYAEASDFAPDTDSFGINYLPDPSLELYTVARGASPRLLVAPIARFGVDTVLRGKSEMAGTLPFMGSNTATADGLRVIVTYLAENFLATRSALGHVPRFVEVDFTAKQPRYALNASGVALIAGAQPATWDGVEVVEAGPLHQPRLRVFPAGGNGPDLSVKTYFRVVYSWRDAAGDLHRSSPSLVQTVFNDVTPGKPRVHVTVPDTLRDGRSQEEFDVTVYQSDNGVEFWSRTDYVPTTKADTWLYDLITLDVPDNATLLYSTGEGGESDQLPAEAPPPLWDVAFVGPRGWGIHGEIRSRAVYTKRREEGVAPEWNSALYFDFPASAGDLVAVAELDGKPTYFTEGGIYVIDGEGPDASGIGMPYSDPRRISDVVCTSRDSVRRYAGGILFVSESRFVIVSSGGGVRILDDVGADDAGEISQVVTLPRTHEVVVLSRTAPALALNYLLERMTRWSTLTGLRQAAMVSATRLIAYDYAGHRLVRVEVNESGADVLTFETGWVQPAGPQGDCNIREVIVQGVWVDLMTLRVLALQDFDEREDAANVAVNELYTAGQLSDARNGTQRYTLRVALDHAISRTLKLKLTATRDPAGTERNFFRPLAVTVPLGVNPGELRRHVAAGMK